MRYFYELNTDGSVKGAYANDQPGKILVYLEEPVAPLTSWNSIWNGTQWIENTSRSTLLRKKEIENLVLKEERFISMLLIHLIQGLLKKGVITATDFSTTDRDLYQKVKAWVDEYVGL